MFKYFLFNIKLSESSTNKIVIKMKHSNIYYRNTIHFLSSFIFKSLKVSHRIKTCWFNCRHSLVFWTLRHNERRVSLSGARLELSLYQLCSVSYCRGLDNSDRFPLLFRLRHA